MKKKLIFLTFILSLVVLLLPSCADEETRPEFPLSAVIHNSIDGKQAAFVALTHSAVSWEWDFGDGNTSTDKEPVHVYKDGGYYDVVLTAKDSQGNSVTKTITIAVAVTPYVLLTGGSTATKGKTWKLSSAHGTLGDYLANADANLTTADPKLTPLPDGAFGQIGMPDVYKDEYTFFFDGSYKHDVKEDGAAFGGLVYQIVLNKGKDIINMNGKDFGLCIAKYTPEADATFTFVEKEDYVVPSVYGGVSFPNAMTLDFSGTEFIGFRDFQSKVVLRTITDSRMQLVMFMAASEKAIGVNTHALILSFEVVK